MGDCPVHSRMLSIISNLYPPQLLHSYDNQNVSSHCQMSAGGQNQPWLRNIELKDDGCIKVMLTKHFGDSKQVEINLAGKIRNVFTKNLFKISHYQHNTQHVFKFWLKCSFLKLRTSFKHECQQSAFIKLEENYAMDIF